jgi:two-component system cell cycle sensor histidine kinase/response regulator CckA
MILVVDDESMIVHFTTHVLEAKGFKVVSTTDSSEAMGVFEESKEAIQLVLTDVIMPGVSGKDLAILIQKMKPSVQVLYMSGYEADILAQRGVVVTEANFIAKPFTGDALFLKVRELLNPKSTSR